MKTSASCQEVTEWHAHKEVEEAKKKSEDVVLTHEHTMLLRDMYR